MSEEEMYLVTRMIARAEHEGNTEKADMLRQILSSQIDIAVMAQKQDGAQ